MSACFCGAILLGFELMDPICRLLACRTDQLETKGYHHAKLDSKDLTMITINKGITLMFIHHYIQCTCTSSWITWGYESMTFTNTLLPLPFMYILYDSVYAVFHRILHLRSLYPWVHKHHHRQAAPSRGFYDAVNVHPFEFGCGEYLQLASMALIPCHVVVAVLFIVFNGILSTLSHTRFDVDFPCLYGVCDHQAHHSYLTCNYGQYIMLWDLAMGTYRPRKQEPTR